MDRSRETRGETSHDIDIMPAREGRRDSRYCRAKIASGISEGTAERAHEGRETGQVHKERKEEAELPSTR